MTVRAWVVSRHAAWITSKPYHLGYSCTRAVSCRSFSCSATPYNRQRVDILAKEIERVFGTTDFLVDVLGAHRRGEQAVQEATILVVGEKDEYEPSSPHTASDHSSKRAKSVTSRLLEEGVLKGSDDAAYITPADESTFPVRIHYASKPCQGAARLFLTGHDSYIRFLKLMAMEMDLILTESGLWRPLQTQDKRTMKESTHGLSVPAGLAIQPIDGEIQESEGDRRMRETRKEMGLPEGLDLSLDLGSGYRTQPSQQAATFEEVEAALAQQLQGRSGEYKRMTGKGGSSSEHDILDILGLVWLPPSMRKLKEPE